MGAATLTWSGSVALMSHQFVLALIDQTPRKKGGRVRFPAHPFSPILRMVQAKEESPRLSAPQDRHN